MSKPGITRIVAIVGALALVAALVLLVLPGGGQKHLVAEFPRTVSLYTGSEVKILGVSVGKVDSVTPAGTKVIVKISYDEKYQLPDDVKAALISPAIVGDRFIQLTPAYKSGAQLPEGARLGLDRTATPLELDQIYSGINTLSKALGPDGANKPDGSGVGALTRLLDSTARNFGGQGVKFNQTLQNLGRLTKTLDDNKDDLFGTARQLEVFIHTLAKNDTTVRAFNDSLDSAADLLAGERQDLAAALRNLGTALVEVKGFVQDNKSLLSKNIKGVNRVAKILVKRRAALDEVLSAAPDALDNLSLAYNKRTGTLDTRANVGENVSKLVSNPAATLCGFLSTAPNAGKNCDAVTKALQLPRASALKRSSVPDQPAEYVDRGLAGLVEVQR